MSLVVCVCVHIRSVYSRRTAQSHCRTVAEQEEWSRLLDQTQQDDPPTTSIEDRLSSASLQLQEESESRSDMEDVKKTVQHYADLLKSLVCVWVGVHMYVCVMVYFQLFPG